MRIAGSFGSAVVHPGRTAPQRGSEHDTPAPTALIPVQPTYRAQRAPVTTCRPLASFLAHLIATHEQVPQTRARRRAEPAEAIAAYRAPPAGPSGRVLAKAL